MAKTRKTETKATERIDVNEIKLTGVVKRVNYSSDKMASYNVDITEKTPKGNACHTWVDVIDFNRTIDLEEGDAIMVIGSLMTQSYDGKNGKTYKVVVKSNEIEANEAPFN